MTDAFPDRSMEHRDKIAWMIETAGWAIEVVRERPDRSPPEPTYAYSVGFESAFGAPEVVVFGLTPVAARGLLGLVAELLEGGTEIPVGPVFLGLYRNDLRAALLPVDLDVHGDLFASAALWYGPAPYRMAQLARPDRNGWMPWEHGYDPRWRVAQPVIGSLDEVDSG